jgi:hypothetical protein
VPRFVNIQGATPCPFELVAQDEVGDDSLDAHARATLEWRDYCLTIDVVRL